MSTLERAIEIAARRHEGQVDKGGQPYILHPIRVMFAVQSLHEKMTAVLHDVVEDTTTTFEDLEREGFPPAVVDAVRALTKTTGESRIDAARRAASNVIARAVKLADVRDNMDLRRISAPTAEDYARIEEYKTVEVILVASMKTPIPWPLSKPIPNPTPEAWARARKIIEDKERALGALHRDKNGNPVMIKG